MFCVTCCGNKIKKNQYWTKNFKKINNSKQKCPKKNSPKKSQKIFNKKKISQFFPHKILIIIYQCYVYRTNIHHIPPEVAWGCDTTSVIRRVWYDECDTMQILWGKNVENLFWLNFVFEPKKMKKKFDFFFEIIFFEIIFFYFFLFFFLFFFFHIIYFLIFFATTRHTEYCALLVAFDNSSRRKFVKVKKWQYVLV